MIAPNQMKTQLRILNCAAICLSMLLTQDVIFTAQICALCSAVFAVVYLGAENATKNN